MTTLDLHPSAADQAVLLDTLRRERSTLATQIEALLGNGWVADITAAHQGLVARYSAEADLQAVLDGQPLAAPVIGADVSEKRRRLAAVNTAIKRIEGERARGDVARLQVDADAATTALRAQTRVALALGEKFRSAVAALRPALAQLEAAVLERDALRAPDVESLPGLRHDAGLESAAATLVLAGDHIEAAAKTLAGQG